MKHLRQKRLIDTGVIAGLFSLILLSLSSTVYAEGAGDNKEFASKNTVSSETNIKGTTDDELQKEEVLSVEEIKKKVIRLNRDLFILEEDLLFPANTQFTVFLSLDSGQFFRPDSVILTLDDEIISSHLYTERQINALAKGGMQRLHIGNVKNGEHELSVVAVGQGTDGREVKRAAVLQFEKDADIASFEVKIRDQSENYQASIEIVKWDN